MPFENKVSNCNEVYLSLGTNVGNKKQQLAAAIQLIEEQLNKPEQISCIYETEAWGYKEQATFYNQVIKINSTLPPDQLLVALNNIEQSMGRVRTTVNRWKERTIDIDILFYNDLIINENNLCIPHPEIQNRRFVLAPLAEIAPIFIHPALKRTISELLKSCTDKSWIRKI